MEIDHQGEQAIYLQLAAILRAQIADGELQPGRPIPSERTLMQRYGVARGTARKAVGVLREEGIVRFSFGRGTFVVPEDERPQ